MTEERKSETPGMSEASPKFVDEAEAATAATFVLRLGALGNVRTTTVKAFPENAYRKIVEAV